MRPATLLARFVFGLLQAITITTSHIRPALAGQPQQHLAPRIVGGVPVGQPSDYPFVAALLRDGLQICAGTVVAPTKVLTAAHCLENVADIRTYAVRVGSLEALAGGQEIAAVHFEPHPHFDRSKSLDYDIAMLTLSSAIDYGPTAAAADLPGENTPPKPGAPLEVIGWGRTSPLLGTNSATLRKATLKAVASWKCKLLWTTRNFGVTERMLCAGAASQDTCTGDSGGPILDPETKVVRGSVTYGTKRCISRRFPGIYTDYGNKEIANWIRMEKVKEYKL